MLIKSWSHIFEKWYILMFGESLFKSFMTFIPPLCAGIILKTQRLEQKNNHCLRAIFGKIERPS